MKKAIREIVNSKNIKKRACLDHVIETLSQMRDNAASMGYVDIDLQYGSGTGLYFIVSGLREETDEEERERENRERERDIQQYEELKEKLGF